MTAVPRPDPFPSPPFSFCGSFAALWRRGSARPGPTWARVKAKAARAARGNDLGTIPSVTSNPVLELYQLTPFRRPGPETPVNNALDIPASEKCPAYSYGSSRHEDNPISKIILTARLAKIAPLNPFDAPSGKQAPYASPKIKKPGKSRAQGRKASKSNRARTLKSFVRSQEIETRFVQALPNRRRLLVVAARDEAAEPKPPAIIPSQPALSRSRFQSA